MMRSIPGNTKVQIELFKGVTLLDMAMGIIAGVVFALIASSSLPFRWILAFVHLFIWALLIARVDKEPNYKFVFNMIRHLGLPRKFSRLYDDDDLKKLAEVGEEEFALDDMFSEKSKSKNSDFEMDDIIAFTGIADGYIEYDKKYYGAVIEIPPVAFRFFSEHRRRNSIESGVGSIIRAVKADYAVNIVKVERPISFDSYRQLEKDKLNELRESYKKGFISEEELKSRVGVVYDRMNELKHYATDRKVVTDFFYLVLFDSDKQQLDNQVFTALESLRQGEMSPKRLNDKEIAVFLRYTNELDFDENEIENIRPEDYAKWAMPKDLRIRQRDVVIDNVITHNMRLVSYPSLVGDAWLAGLMSFPSTKVVIKAKPMDRTKSIRAIDLSLSELRANYMHASTDSQQLEIQTHIETLQELLVTLQNENESLLSVNVYVSAYDIVQSGKDPSIPERETESFLTQFNAMKKNVRRAYTEAGFRLNGMDFNQFRAFVGSQVSAYDPMEKQGRGMPSNTIAATFPWIYASIKDEKGTKFGVSSGVPVMIDFFRRDSERVNSNMVIVGKSGSGKSYATKSILTNLAADDSKIFILDPENEYTELAQNLHGKFINVGNAQYGRLNPFHIITALEDDEGEATSDSYSTHLQFLEEFFTQILPDCEKDALEYLNSLVDRTYSNKGINAGTDLSKLKPSDYPIFDDLYDEILKEFQRTDNEYIRTMLRTLMNYVSKFSEGGRNATIWNGPSSVTTDENFTVFNFQSLLANRNSTIANAQMLLVLKYIDNEIIKNREYNKKYGLNRKIVVVIDEAHVFIDTKFPVALDFMFQLAKRIRKYNGMQIVITQNIKDFVGSEEIARKSTAIINACQYSFIFSLSPNDMDDLCRLYEKAGGINEQEQEEIVQAQRGQAFTIMSPTSRSSFKITVPETTRKLFEEDNYPGRYFRDELGLQKWDEFLGTAKEEREAFLAQKKSEQEESGEEEEKTTGKVRFSEISAEEYDALALPAPEKTQTPLMDENLDFSIGDIPEDPEEFEAMLKKKKQPEPAEVRMPQVIVQAPASSSKTEEMLTRILDRFSRESMLSEIRHTVNELVSERLSGMNLGAAVVNTNISKDSYFEAEEEPEKEDIFAAAEDEDADIGSFDFSFDEDEDENADAGASEDADDGGFDFSFDDEDEGSSSEGGTDGGFSFGNDDEGSFSFGESDDDTFSFGDDDDFSFSFGDEDEEAEEGAILGRITPVKVPADQAVRGDFEGETDEDGEPLFSDTEVSLDQDVDTSFYPDDLFGEDDDDDDEAPSFDIMQFLSVEASKIESSSPIDDMLALGEKSCEITLEQLAAYIKNDVA